MHKFNQSLLAILFALVLVAQMSNAVHSIEHQPSEHSGWCQALGNADLGGFTLESAPEFLFGGRSEVAAPLVLNAPDSPLLKHYAGRAPPAANFS